MIFESTQQLTVSLPLIQVFGGRENVDCGEGGMGRPGEGPGEGEGGAHRDWSKEKLRFCTSKHSEPSICSPSEACASFKTKQTALGVLIT